MMTGDLVRCRDYRIEETDDWDQIGLVVRYDSLMKTVHVLVQSTGEIKKYRWRFQGRIPLLSKPGKDTALFLNPIFHTINKEEFKFNIKAYSYRDATADLFRMLNINYIWLLNCEMPGKHFPNNYVAGKTHSIDLTKHQKKN